MAFFDISTGKKEFVIFRRSFKDVHFIVCPHIESLHIIAFSQNILILKTEFDYSNV